MPNERKTIPLHAGFSSSFKNAAKPSPGLTELPGIQRLQIGGEHVQAGSGKLVTYKVDLAHGADTTNYEGRVLLLGAKWHELEGGTVTGTERSARTQQVSMSVLAQIDQLDLEALNKG